MKRLALAVVAAIILPLIVVVGNVSGQTPPPPPPPPATIGPPPPPGGATSTPTAVPTSTATAVPTSTSTPVPTATNTPVPLTVSASIAHKTVAPNKKQKITVTTLPGADVTISVKFPNNKKKSHEGSANGSGTLSWQFTQPAKYTTAKSKTAKVSIKATLDGQSASTSKKYNIGPGA